MALGFEALDLAFCESRLRELIMKGAYYNICRWLSLLPLLYIVCYVIYIYIYIFIYTHVYTYIYIYIYTFTGMYIYIYICLWIRVYTYLSLYLSLSLFIYIYIYIYVHIHVYIHMYVYIHTRMYICHIYRCCAPLRRAGPAAGRRLSRCRARSYISL